MFPTWIDARERIRDRLNDIAMIRAAPVDAIRSRSACIPYRKSYSRLKEQATGYEYESRRGANFARVRSRMTSRFLRTRRNAAGKASGTECFVGRLLN